MRPEKPGAAGRSLFASILRRIIAAARLPQALASGAASVGSLWMTCGTEAGSARAAIASRSLRRCPTVGNAKVFEIISRQLGQDLGVNLVLPERLLIALQPQLPQPKPRCPRASLIGR